MSLVQIAGDRLRSSVIAGSVSGMPNTKVRKPRTPWSNPAINGSALRDARLGKVMTLVEVCEACARLNPLVPVDDSNLSRYERGEVSPSPKRLRIIAQVLGLDEDDLLIDRRGGSKAA